MARPVALEPGPLVTLVRSRTVAKVDNDRIGRLQGHPVLGGVVEEGQEDLGVVDDLGTALGHFAP
jgi:hypothetical protein